MNDINEIPQPVMNEWLRQCTCCFVCGQMRPCNGVMAGGLCDNACHCEDEFDQEEFSDSEYDIGN
jgi:hypothetical protein